MVAKMNKLYLLMAVCALVIGAFFYGSNLADSKCQMRHITESAHNQTQIIKKQRIIHENVYKTGVGDIRRILRDKYTIAE